MSRRTDINIVVVVLRFYCAVIQFCVVVFSVVLIWGGFYGARRPQNRNKTGGSRWGLVKEGRNKILIYGRDVDVGTGWNGTASRRRRRLHFSALKPQTELTQWDDLSGFFWKAMIIWCNAVRCTVKRNL